VKKRKATDAGKAGVTVTITPIKHTQLPAEKEQQLLKRWKRGDESVREILLRNYFPYIAGLAKKYHNYFPWIQFTELLEEGNFGVLQALGHYDPGRKARFTSYAWFWITKCMQEYISQHVVFLKIPTRVLRNLRKIEKQIEREVQKNNSLSINDIVEKIDGGLDEVKSLLSERASTMTPLSLDQCFGGDDDEQRTLKDYITGDDQRSEEALEKSEDKERIVTFLSQLTMEESEIIQWRFGFKDNAYHSLKDLSQKMKLTTQKVKDLEARALMKLKCLLAGTDD